MERAKVVIWLAHGRIDRSWQPTSLRNARSKARQRPVLVAHGKEPTRARPEGIAGPAAADLVQRLRTEHAEAE
jgi:hypothetical protein